MDRVLDRLWVGDSADLDSRLPLRALGFSAVVDLRDDTVASPKGVALLHIANRDGDPWNAHQVEQALTFIAEHVRLGRVLVACAAGMSRSVSMVIGYLVRTGFDVATAYEMVKMVRPQVRPVESMVDSVLRVALAPVKAT
ncbi:MAG: hypothetical protein EPN91_01015 [Salinibacterium sp.]|nr:MAG: hypothetical protein EPN91_01015 [Salinibacterium sp.]